mmetsp:Transcript_54174/g.80440  ORF Transcript_54174/g.80440 Transcript_54174/m.80440 type:complete len:80 (-) Transcript_54174:478-717(-)
MYVAISHTSSSDGRAFGSTDSILEIRSCKCGEYFREIGGYFPRLIFSNKDARFNPGSLNGLWRAQSSYRMHPSDQTSEG